jgi:hypothetical protein
MDDDFVLLMDVKNDIEADNVKETLEIEGIDAVIKYSPGECSKSVREIYVPLDSYEDAWGVIETEMTRGDF